MRIAVTQMTKTEAACPIGQKQLQATYAKNVFGSGLGPSGESGVAASKPSRPLRFSRSLVLPFSRLIFGGRCDQRS